MQKYTVRRAERPLALAIAVALGIGGAHASTITVITGGDAGNTATCTLRQAIESANNDDATGSACVTGSFSDAVVFAPALANATITLGGTALQVSANMYIAGNGQTIDAGGASQVLRVTGGVTARIGHLTLTGGSSTTNGGAVYVDGSNLTLNEVTISDSTAGSGRDGGGMFAMNSDLTLTNVTLSGNSAAQGGGGLNLYTFGDIPTVASLDHVTMSGNSAGDVGGGGLRVVAGESTTTVELIHSVIEGNIAKLDGGGIAVIAPAGEGVNLTLDQTTVSSNISTTGAGGGIEGSGSGTSITLTGSTVSSNVGKAGGGGLAISNYGSASVSYSLVTSNVGKVGGGILAREHSSLSIESSDVSHNSAFAGFGNGTKYSPNPVGGGVMAVQGSGVTVHASTIRDNFAFSSGGGLVVAGNKVNAATGNYSGDNGAHMVVTDSTISGNSATVGSVAYVVQGGTLTLHDSTVANNQAVEGGGVVVRGQASAGIFQSTIVNNATTAPLVPDSDAARYAAGLEVWPGCTVVLNNSVLAGNTSVVPGESPDAHVHDGATLTAKYSLLGTQLQADYTTDGNVFSDTPGLGQLTDNGGPTPTMAPQPGSPVLDVGSNALVPTGMTTDQRGDGYPRILNGTVDIGAVEGVGDVIYRDGFEDDSG